MESVLENVVTDLGFDKIPLDQLHRNSKSNIFIHKKSNKAHIVINENIKTKSWNIEFTFRLYTQSQKDNKPILDEATLKTDIELWIMDVGLDLFFNYGRDTFISLEDDFPDGLYDATIDYIYDMEIVDHEDIKLTNIQKEQKFEKGKYWIGPEGDGFRVEDLEFLLEYFVDIEAYEKCIVIKKFIDQYNKILNDN